MKLSDSDLCLCGHDHRGCCVHANGKICCKPARWAMPLGCPDNIRFYCDEHSAIAFEGIAEWGFRLFNLFALTGREAV